MNYPQLRDGESADQVERFQPELTYTVFTQGTPMFLDLAKAAFFFLSILSLFHAAVVAFFMPGQSWQERLTVTLVYLAFSATICLFSGLLFSWPAQSNPDRGQPLASTLPMRLFLWSSVLIGVLFLSSWYLGDLAQSASPYISDRTLQRF